jgi:hypothetical protein
MILVHPSQLTEHAFANFQLPNPADPSHPRVFAFLFWNADGRVVKAADITVDVPNHDFAITQWYVQTDGNGTPPCRIDTYPFSASQDQFGSDTPIASVTPQAAWKAGTTSVDTTNADVQITARDTRDTEEFDQWMVLWGSATSDDKVLSASKKAYAVAAAAFAKEKAIPVCPHPEWEIVDTLDALRRKLINPGDPPPDYIRRIVDRIRQEALAEKSGVLDNITEIFTRIGEMSPTELRQASTEIKGQIRRLQAAQKAIESASKGAR